MTKTPIPDSYWIEKGKLLAGEYPGAESESEAREKLRAFLEAGITYFIDLTEEQEPLEPYSDLLRSEAENAGREVVHHRMPIRDVSAPTVDFMDEIQEAISDALEAGHAVYVHCWGGVGRTGTVAGCYLVEQGMSGEEAIEHLAKLRAGTPKAHRKSPETSDQEAMIREWVMEDEDSEWEKNNGVLEETLNLIAKIQGSMASSLSIAKLAVPVETDPDDEDDFTFTGFLLGDGKQIVLLAFTNMDEVAAYFEDEPSNIAIMDAVGLIRMLADADRDELKFDGLIINPASEARYYIPAESLAYIAADLSEGDEED